MQDIGCRVAVAASGKVPDSPPSKVTPRVPSLWRAFPPAETPGVILPIKV